MLEPGVIVAGDFRIDDVLGDGGMGVVYQATQLSLDRTVALKLITKALSQDFAFRERFRHEGRVQAKLEHVHIIDVYAAGESDYGLFLAMRLVHGPSLNELVGTPALTVHRTVRLLSQIASALDAAHAVGLVHRDIKPHNILIDDHRDHAYLADFGVTKARGAVGMTQVGQRVGTLTYMAPEQFRGQSATELSDIYSFGAVVYECLVGDVPYPMPTEASLITAHLTEPVPRVSEHRPGLPPAIDRVIEKAMAKDPEERYTSASDLMREIAQGVGVTPAAAGTVASVPETAISPVASDRTLPSPSERVGPGTDAPSTGPGVETPEPLAPPAAGTALTPTAPAPETSIAPPAEQKPPTEIAPPAGKPPTEIAPQPVAPATRLAAAAAKEQPRAEESEGAAVPAAAGAPATSLSGPPRVSTPTAIPTSAAAEPDAERPLRPAGRVGRKAVLGIAAVSLVLAAAGFTLGHANAPSHERTIRAPTRHAVRSGDITLSAPAAWRKQTAVPAIPGLRLTNAVSLGPNARPGDVGSIVGHVAPAWPTYLPAAFRRAIGQRAVAGHELVRLGDLSAFRYARLRPRGFDGIVTVYAVPQASATTIVACYSHAPAGSLGSCDTVAASLQVANAKAYPLDPSPQYAAAINRTLGTLNAARRRGLATLAAGKTAGRQAEGASAVAAAYARAAGALGGAKPTPYVRPANIKIVSALRQVQSSYARLAAAARAGNDALYTEARRRVRSTEAALQRELALLARLGFRL